MRFPLLLSMVLPSIALAHPHFGLTRRYDTHIADTSAAGESDLNVMNFALFLEHLEVAFYEDATANFTQENFAEAGFDNTFFRNIKRLAKDEALHVDYLTRALQAAGVKPVPACTYNFPYTDVMSFAKLAAIIEGVGVGAYSGAASSIQDGSVLTALATVLSVEVRHNSVLRESVNELPFSSAFDIPLDFNQAYSIASQFVVECPYPTPFVLRAFPRLIALPYANDALPTAGSKITLRTPGYTLAPARSAIPKRQEQSLHAAFLTVNGPVFTDVNQTGPDTYTVVVPVGLVGQNYVVLSSCSEAINDATTAAGPAIIEIG